MFKNYLKIAIRNFKRQKVFSFINIGGLAIGIACCILILLWIRNELCYDRFHENADNIYRITQDHKFEGHSATTYLPLGKNLVVDFPEINSVVRIFPMEGLIEIDNDRIFKEDRLFYADSSFLKVFSFPLLKGDAENALNRPNTVVITEYIAKKYFSSSNPIGKLISFDNITIDNEPQKNLQITGVLKDIPENSHLQFDFIVSLTTFSELSNFEQYGWHYPLIYTYVLLSPNSSSNQIGQKMPDFVSKHLSHKEQGLRNFYLQSLNNIHLHSHLKYELSDNGNIAYVYIFSIVAIFIISIACISYMNLSTARSVKRAKEIGMSSYS